MSILVRVAPCNELSEGAIHTVRHEDLVIAVVNIDNSFYAVDGKCGHAGGPLCRGEVNKEDRSISCPWHGWEYDLTSGECLFDSSLKQKTFEVKVEDGVVFVAVE